MTAPKLATLNNALTNILLYCEHINETAVRLVDFDAKEPPSAKAVGEESRRTFRAALNGDPSSSEFFSTIRGAKPNLEIDEDALDAVDRELKKADAQWPVAESVKNLTYYRKEDSGPLPSSNHLSDQDEVLSLKGARVWSAREFVNPVSIAQEYVANDVGLGPRYVDHYIQLWIKQQFNLHYTQNQNALKVALADVTRLLNTMFFEMEAPPSQAAHLEPAHNISASLLISQMARTLTASLKKQTPSFSSTPQSKARIRFTAISIFLVLRFARIFTCDHRWLISADQAKQLKEHSGEPNDSEERRRRSVRAAHPIEYTYLKIRAFGDLTGIPGLNSIMRGGILPHTLRGRSILMQGPPGSGKTAFALQLMADMASRGRLAVYFSLEESYELILDRLITFGFRNDRYEVKYVTLEEIADAIETHELEHPQKGLLLLYRFGDNERELQGRVFSPMTAVRRIKEACSKVSRFKWRALALDSTSPLHLLEAREGQASEPPQGGDQQRVALRALVEEIEECGFLGILISANDSPNTALLPALCDSVFELSTSDSGTQRYIKITKSRPQNFQEGPHPFRIRDGKGIQIYPSIATARSRLSRRMRVGMDRDQGIPLPPPFAKSIGHQLLPEASTSLIYGASGAGKRALVLNLLTEPTLSKHHPQGDRGVVGTAVPERKIGVRSTLYVTFRTPEKRFRELFDPYTELCEKWDDIGKPRLRWYSPGQNMSAPQLADSLWHQILDAKREGFPIQRIAFSQMEAAQQGLPMLADCPLFWSVVLEIVATEGITTFFVVSDFDEIGKNLVRDLSDNLDYSFRLSDSDDSDYPHKLTVMRRPMLDSRSDKSNLFRISPGGLLDAKEL